MMEELCLHIIDIAQNSVAARSETVKILVLDSLKENVILIEVADNGKGMDETMVENVQNPFFTTKSGKKVGLGVPLLKESALHCDGKFSINSTVGVGTTVSASFKKDHIDTPPLGDLKSTIFTLIIGTAECNIDFTYTTDKGNFNLSINQIKEEIGDIPLTHPDVIKFVRDFIDENISAIQ